MVVGMMLLSACGSGTDSDDPERVFITQEENSSVGPSVTDSAENGAATITSGNNTQFIENNPSIGVLGSLQLYTTAGATGGQTGADSGGETAGASTAGGGETDASSSGQYIEPNPSEGILGLLEPYETAGTAGDTGENTTGATTGANTTAGTTGGQTGGTATGGETGGATTGGQTGGATTTGGQTGGTTTGSQTGGTTTGGQTGGTTTGGQTGGTTTGGQTGGTTTGSQTGGTTTGGQTGGTTTGAQTGGTTTGGQTGGTTTGGTTTGGQTGGTTTGADTGGATTGGTTTGGGTGGESPPVIVIENAIKSVEFGGVKLDQIFQNSQTEYTATVGYLFSVVTVFVNGQPVQDIELNESKTQVFIESAKTGIRYTFVIYRQSADEIQQQANLDNSVTQRGSGSARAVSLSGDRIAVVNRSQERHVTVFFRDHGVWNVEALLPVSADSVSLHGEWLAIGDTRGMAAQQQIFANDQSMIVPSEDDSSRINLVQSEPPGVVHLYSTKSGRWSYVTSVQADNADAGDGFGFSVGLSQGLLAVGAPQEDSSSVAGSNNNMAAESGAVYVFGVEDERWVQQAFLKSSVASAGDYFGAHLDLQNDLLAVSATTMKGSNDETDITNDGGAAYVFERINSVWYQQARVQSALTTGTEQFARSVAIWQDTLAVSAPRSGPWFISEGSADHAVDYQGNAGSVYVYNRNSSGWTFAARLQDSHTGSSDEFGSALALQGNTLAVGARFADGQLPAWGALQLENSGHNDAGVYVYLLEHNQWQQAMLIGSGKLDAPSTAHSALALDNGTLVVGTSGAVSASGSNDTRVTEKSQPGAGAPSVFH